MSTLGVDLTVAELIDLKQTLMAVTLRARRKIRDNLSGARLSRIKGHGIDFDEVREYQLGDDIRSIDWKTSARLQTTYSKVYKEERERPILLLVDLSASMRFGTKVALKSVIAARLATLLAYLALHHQDRVGAVVFSEFDHLELKPSSTKIAIQKLIQSLILLHQPALTRRPNSGDMKMAQALLLLKRGIRPGSLIFLISDFSHFDVQSRMITQQLGKHNDIVLNFIYDPLEHHAPKPGEYLVNDGAQHRLLLTYEAKKRQLYDQLFINREQLLTRFCVQNGQNLLPVRTDEDLAQILLDKLHFFRR